MLVVTPDWDMVSNPDGGLNLTVNVAPAALALVPSPGTVATAKNALSFKEPTISTSFCPRAEKRKELTNEKCKIWLFVPHLSYIRVIAPFTVLKTSVLDAGYNGFQAGSLFFFFFFFLTEHLANQKEKKKTFPLNASAFTSFTS